MRPTFIIPICVTALLAASSPAAAQAQRPERPYRGLFGGGAGDVEQSLIWNASTGAGYDDNVWAEEGISDDPSQAQAGNFGSFATGLSYSYSKPRLSIGLSGNMNGRYRPNSSDEFYAGYGAGGGLSFPLWRGAHFTANQSVGYQPYFVFDPIVAPFEPVVLGGAVVQDPGFAGVVGEDYISYSTSASLSQQTSKRGSLSADFDRQTSDFASAETDFVSRSAGLGYSHNIGKGLDVNLGYGYSESSSDSVAGEDPIRVHSINAGVNFNRALSFSRRTTLSFSTGSAGVADASGTQYHITGSALLQRELGRTWAAGLSYDRRVQFVDALRRAILSDGAAASIGGLISRSLQFSARAGVSFAHSGTSGAKEYDTYLATAGVNYAITRYLALGVNYSFYRYKFAQGAVPPPGYSQEMDRQGIRANLSVWAPIFQRARRPDAAR